MRIYGLTGGIGSGKSAVAERLRARGIPVVDADEVAHVLTRPGGRALPAVTAAFGPPVARPDGTIDRAALARLAFSDPAARRTLEALLHPLIDEDVRAWTAARAAEGHAVCVYAAPLLFEVSLDRRLDGVIVVLADEELRVRRVVARDGSSPDAVRARMAAQLGDDERLRRAQYVIRNDGTLEELARQVDAIVDRWQAAP